MSSPARTSADSSPRTGLRRFWFLAVALVPVACSPAFLPPPPDAAMLGRSQASPALVQRGYVVHQEKCAKCHAFVDPSGYSREELTRSVMPEMGEKAKLSQADQEAVLAYLLAVRQK